MSSARFLAPTAALSLECFRLDGPEGRHAALVRRARVGEVLHLTDGQGVAGRAVVEAVGPDWVQVRVEDREVVPPPRPLLAVAQALAKGEADERAVAALTEVGVDVLVPWRAERSVVRWAGPRGERALQRWQATARESAKQACRAWIPEITAPATTAELAGRVREATLAVLLDPAADMPLAAAPLPTDGAVLVLVGPEGGVADRERADLVRAGAVPCRLGPSVLRTSTAGVAAAAIVSARCGRWA